jgi:hypothetical protein
VEGFAQRNPGELMGRCSSHQTVNFPGAPELLGCIVDVRITEALKHTLRGALADAGQDTAHGAARADTRTAVIDGSAGRDTAHGAASVADSTGAARRAAE